MVSDGSSRTGRTQSGSGRTVRVAQQSAGQRSGRRVSDMGSDIVGRSDGSPTFGTAKLIRFKNPISFAAWWGWLR
jgi:hypothetical protein